MFLSGFSALGSYLMHKEVQIYVSLREDIAELRTNLEHRGAQQDVCSACTETKSNNFLQGWAEVLACLFQNITAIKRGGNVLFLWFAAEFMNAVLSLCFTPFPKASFCNSCHLSWHHICLCMVIKSYVSGSKFWHVNTTTLYSSKVVQLFDCDTNCSVFLHPMFAGGFQV